MKLLNLTELVFVLSLVIPYASCLTCLKCDSVIKPHLCQDAEQCGVHEVCTTEAFVSASGAIRFKIGCKDRMFCPSSATPIGKRDQQALDSISEVYNLDEQREKKEVAICDECCDTDLCNSGGCGLQGFNLNLGPICYSCTAQIGTNGCQKIEQCGRDKICGITAINLPGETNAYMTSCKHPVDCASVPQTGSGQCSACCSTSLCNSFSSPSALCNAMSHGITTPSSTTVKQIITTPQKSTTMNVPTIPTTKTPSQTGCIYENKKYHEGDSWRDGCKYSCHCADGNNGLYACTPLCLTWKLRDSCYLRPADPGKCCPQPICPSYVTIKYPTNYVEHNCSLPCPVP